MYLLNTPPCCHHGNFHFTRLGSVPTSHLNVTPPFTWYLVVWYRARSVSWKRQMGVISYIRLIKAVLRPHFATQRIWFVCWFCRAVQQPSVSNRLAKGQHFLELNCLPTCWYTSCIRSSCTCHSSFVLVVLEWNSGENVIAWLWKGFRTLPSVSSVSARTNGKVGSDWNSPS